MRKLLFVVAVLTISATAHAGPSFQVAENDEPPAPSTITAAEPAKPTAPTAAVAPAKAAEPAPVAESKPVQTQKAKPRVSRRESDEHKARRIAAKFGVYW